MSIVCPLCQTSQVEPFLLRYGYQIVRCIHCAFLFVTPRPDINTLHEFYQNPSYFKGNVENGYKDYSSERLQIEELACRRLDFIAEKKNSGDLLDVGCAAGYFLRIGQERGWNIDAVEWAKDIAESAQDLLGIRIHRTFEELEFTGKKFDVITMWEYIEHVLTPRDQILMANKLLSIGGVFALSTPNADNIGVRRKKGKWKQFKPPEHLNFFTSGTLSGILTSCGFEPYLVKGIAPIYNRAPNFISDILSFLKKKIGDRETKATYFWWIYSVARNLTQMVAIPYHRQIVGEFLCSEGIEVYAVKIKDVHS